jgi:hypothetical protein
MLLDENRASEPQEGCRVGEDPDYVGPSFDFFIHPFDGIRGPDLTPVLYREAGEREDVRRESPLQPGR